MRPAAVKKEVFALLVGEEQGAALDRLRALPRPAVLKALFSGICRHEELLRWRAISALGAMVAQLADEEMEAARIVIRRFMWSLNDESGGIGWGAPEAMAECLARHPVLAEEYAHILVAFMREEGFFLEYPPLQQGLMWGIGRLAEARPALLQEKKTAIWLPAYLNSPDPVVRGLAARALGYLKASECRAAIAALRDHPFPIRLYQEWRIIPTSEGQLAREALARLAPHENP